VLQWRESVFFFLQKRAIINIRTFFQIIYFDEPGMFFVNLEVRPEFPGGGPEVFSGVFIIAKGKSVRL